MIPHSYGFIWKRVLLLSSVCLFVLAHKEVDFALEAKVREEGLCLSLKRRTENVNCAIRAGTCTPRTLWRVCVSRSLAPITCLQRGTLVILPYNHYNFELPVVL
jgi:hypothetical protein